MAGLKLDPVVLRGAYDFLTKCLPFSKWKMPPSRSIRFKVMKNPDTRGLFVSCGGKDHEIHISDTAVGHTNSLMRTMAHEMVHVHLSRKSPRTVHGAAFKKAASLVCKHHGFDEKEF